MLYPESYPPRVRRKGLHSDVVRMLGMRIVRGDHQPGDVLPRAEEMAQELGVSRTVVREATRVLAEKGLVESRQRAGTWVRERSHWNLVDPEVMAWQRQTGPDLQFFRDVSEVRVAIEATAARLAAVRATPDETAAMEGLFARMEESLDDPETYARLDLELHSTILHATHNALLAQLSHTISEGLVASRDVTVRSPGANRASMPLHFEVVRAIAERDAERAAAVMTTLVERALVDIEAVFAARGRAGGDQVA